MSSNITPTNIRLSGERKIQLEEIVQLTGAGSLSAAIGELIKLARTQGIIAHSIPGVTINSFCDGMAISFDDAAPTSFPHEGVAALAATIRKFVNGAEQAKATHNLDHNFSVSRRGTSFKVAIPENSATPKTWAADIALEFADLIEEASMKAKAA